MPDDYQKQLEKLGLLDAEAEVYLALIRNGPLGASAIASVTGVPRSSVYPTLNSLAEKGLVQAGAGYGSRFSPVAPERALPTLITREKEEIAERERLAGKLVQQLSALVEPAEAVPEELIQVIRNPRGVAERFDRSQLEAEQQVEGFVKAPFFFRQDNPAQKKALGRGVRYRCLYERAALDVAVIRPNVGRWLANGEEGRIYDGHLPHKLAIFDRSSVLVHLTMPGDQMRTLFIRHAELASSFGMLFDSLWERSKPFPSEELDGNTPGATRGTRADANTPLIKPRRNGQRTQQHR